MRVIRQLTTLMLVVSAVVYVQAVLITDTGPGNLDGWAEPLIVQNTYTFTNGNYARGSVKFDNGFTVSAGANINMLVDNIVDGPIVLNAASKVNIFKDLYLGSNSLIFLESGTASLFANKHKIFFTHDLRIFSQSNAFIAVRDGIFSGFNNTCKIDTSNILLFFTLDLSGVFNGFENLKIDSSVTNPIFFNSQATILLKSVDYVLKSGPIYEISNDYLCQDSVRFLGVPGSVLTHNEGTLTIDTASQVYFAPGVEYKWQPLNTFETPKIVFNDRTSQLFFDNAIINLEPFYNYLLSPFKLLKGTVIFNGAVHLKQFSNPAWPSQVVNFGDGNPANDLNMVFLSGARLKFYDRVSINLLNVN